MALWLDTETNGNLRTYVFSRSWKRRVQMFFQPRRWNRIKGYWMRRAYYKLFLYVAFGYYDLFDVFSFFTFPIIQRVTPTLIAHELVSVQPMRGAETEWIHLTFELSRKAASYKDPTQPDPPVPI